MVSEGTTYKKVRRISRLKVRRRSMKLKGIGVTLLTLSGCPHGRTRCLIFRWHAQKRNIIRGRSLLNV